jgi:hypothetical protein
VRAARPLDFLVIGAARSGTTSLHHHLSAHPGISLPANKEAPFFCATAEDDQGWNGFSARLFGRGSRQDGRLLGKVTPQYMAGSLYWARRDPPALDPTRLIGTDDPETAATIVPRRIADHRPDIKLIAILRDPVERAISHYRHAVMQGWEAADPDLAFARALAPETLRRARLLPSECISAYVTFGEYARILGGYRSVFGAEQLRVLSFADVVHDPATAIEQIVEFVGLPPSPLPPRADRRFNASASSPRLPWVDTRAIERRASEWDAGQRLWPRMPPGAQRLVDRLFAWASSLEERHNRVPMEDVSSGPGYERVRERLRAHYAPWNDRLVTLCGHVRGVTES